MAKDNFAEFDSLGKLTEFFDNNDMSNYWQTMPKVDAEVSITKKTRLIAIEETLAQRLAEVASAKQMSPDVLIQTWLREKLETDIL